MAATVGKPDGRTTRHAHRRGELITAATNWAVQHGFENISLRPVADGIWVTHATLLHHFGSKETLISEMLHELRERDRAMIAQEGERLRGAPLETVLRAAWDHMSSAGQRAYWGQVFRVYGVALAKRDRFEHFLDGAVTDWLTLAEGILAEAGCPPENRSEIATLVISAFRGTLLDLLVTDDLTRTTNAIALLVKAVTAHLNQIRPTSA